MSEIGWFPKLVGVRKLGVRNLVVSEIGLCPKIGWWLKIGCPKLVGVQKAQVGANQLSGGQRIFGQRSPSIGFGGSKMVVKHLCPEILSHFLLKIISDSQ